MGNDALRHQFRRRTVGIFVLTPDGWRKGGAMLAAKLHKQWPATSDYSEVEGDRIEERVVSLFRRVAV